MGKKLSDTYMDNGPQWLKDNASKLIVCDGEPTSYADATTLVSGGGKKLGEVAVATGDFTLADGDTSGRKVTVAAKSDINIDNATGGDADHIAIVYDSGSDLSLVTTISPAKTGLAQNDKVNTPAFDDEIADPT